MLRLLILCNPFFNHSSDSVTKLELFIIILSCSLYIFPFNLFPSFHHASYTLSLLRTASELWLVEGFLVEELLVEGSLVGVLSIEALQVNGKAINGMLICRNKGNSGKGPTTSISGSRLLHLV